MRTLVVFLVAAGTVQGQQAPPRDLASPAAAGSGVIAGRVVVADASPPKPIRRARVSLSGGALRAPEVTDTDVEGNYRFTGLPAGSYRLTASKPGFVTLESGAARHGQRGPAIELKDGQAALAGIALPRGAAIEGRIVDASGEPVQNIIVSASRFTYSAVGRRTAALKQARTDDLGRYRIHSLPFGEYIVEAAPDPRLEVNQGMTAGADRPPGRGHTFFPGTPQVHQARRIALATGQEVRGTDFALEAVPLARVGGRVIDSTGAPAKTFGFRMVPVGSNTGVSGTLPGEGRFHLPSVPPGDYWLLASLLANPNAVGEFAAQRVTISGQDMPDLTVVTAPGAVLEGQVEAAGRSALPVLKGVRVEAIETEFALPPSRPPMPPAQPAADGRFTIKGLFGPRVLRLTGLPAGWALTQVWLDDTEIIDTVTDFRISNAPRRLRMVISDATGTVTGTVRSRAGAASAYEVILFPEGEKSRSATSRFVHRASPRADGTFLVTGLLPGRYIAAAVDHLDDGTWNDPEVLKRIAAAGTPVTVIAGGAKPLTLNLQVLR
jgi:hypothetical protein